MASHRLVLNGQNLTVSDVFNVITKNIPITINALALKKVKKSHNLLKQHISKNKVLYGVNTGFGPMASHLLPSKQIVELQKNLIRSHSAGLGKPIPEEFVRAAMIIRCNTLLKGYSGISLELIKRLAFFVNQRISPVVPEHGAVGTSGDLIQLAHIAEALMGEGKVFFKGKTYQTSALLKKLGLPPYQLKPKEGLALINGTAVMSGISSVVISHAWMLQKIAVMCGALALELVQAYDDSISTLLHEVRPHRGQKEIASELRHILKDSHLLRSREKLHTQYSSQHDIVVMPEAVQEIYSLRCIPQILGPIRDILNKVQNDVETEINSVTDNPILDPEGDAVLHGGNFHGDYISLAMDELKITTVKLSMLSERRINFFLSAKVNKVFPPFLNIKKPGLTLGLQGLQFVATSTTARNQTLAFPQYVHSISTNGENQDVVSMGTDSALLANEVVQNTFLVLAIELVTLTQAVECTQTVHKLSSKTRNLYDKVRRIVPKIEEDRSLSEELNNLTEALKSGKIL